MIDIKLPRASLPGERRPGPSRRTELSKPPVMNISNEKEQPPIYEISGNFQERLLLTVLLAALGVHIGIRRIWYKNMIE